MADYEHRRCACGEIAAPRNPRCITCLRGLTPPAPKPDELTVDDVLGVLEGILIGVESPWVYGDRWGFLVIRDISGDAPVYEIDDGERPADRFSSLRAALTEAKGRGWIG